MIIPKVFISYSHDTIEHKEWVLNLGIRLRSNGIDAILDLWELSPGDDLPTFMEQNLSSSDYILMVCTERYVEKANSGKGGVGYEKMIITSSLLTSIDQNKIIPIIKQESQITLPTFLKSRKHINFSAKDEFEICLDELLRALHKSPLFIKPEIGNNPFSEANLNSKPMPTKDVGKEIMKFIIAEYENGENESSIYKINEQAGISRIMFDLILSELKTKDYIGYDQDFIWLKESGKIYAVSNNLIN